MVPVASPEYFKQYPVPKVPGDLTAHRCINYRSTGSGGLYAWEFERKGRRMSVRVDGPLIFNTSDPILDAALAGLGIAFLLEDECAAHIEGGRLVPILEDWCQPFPGYYLYYPSRRQISPAFRLVIEALRLRNN